MIREVEKQPKIALCHKCRGTGKIQNLNTQEETTCDQCEGSGRVKISARMVFDIRPYKPKT